MDRQTRIENEAGMIRAGLDYESMRHALSMAASQSENGEHVTVYLRGSSGKMVASTKVKIGQEYRDAIAQARADFQRMNPKAMKSGNCLITFD